MKTEINNKFVIKENSRLTSRTWKLVLNRIPELDERMSHYAGKFVNIAIPGKYLRRPISVHRIYPEQNKLVLLYNVVGEGTQILSELAPGTELDVLGMLGNGFSVHKDIRHPLLLGGGIGCAPLMQLAMELLQKGVQPQVILGFNSAEECWGMEKELNDLNISCYIATIDGSKGTKGYVTDVIREKQLDFDYFYACGPMPMLRTLVNLPEEGELSLECRMGCGFGACVCCSIETVNGSRRICKDGPVFKKSDMIWKQ